MTSSLPVSAPFIVLHGEDRFRQLDLTDHLRAALAKAHGSTDLIAFDGASASAADILDECRSMGLMQQHKLVVVDNADALLKAADDEEDAGSSASAAGRSRRPAARTPRELFQAYAEAPEPAAVLVLRAATWRPGNLDKAIAKAGGVVLATEPPSSAEALAWIKDRARSAHSTTLAPDAATLLLERIGPDLGRLDSELAKLALAVKPSKSSAKPTGITLEHVHALVGFSREEDAWDFQRDLLAGNPQSALAALHRRLEVSRHQPVLIGIVCLDLARKLDGATRGLAAKENPFAVSKRLRLWGPSAEPIMSKARKLTPRASAALFQAAISADMAQKSGGGDPVHILETLVLRFASLGA